jgi:hypothetical protein
MRRGRGFVSSLGGNRFGRDTDLNRLARAFHIRSFALESSKLKIERVDEPSQLRIGNEIV